VTNQFNYLLDKIAAAPFQSEPFKHVEIRDFLAPEHFKAIVTQPQIALSGVSSTEELLEALETSGYQPVSFPGCLSSAHEYLDWFHGRSRRKTHGATEGFGIVYRLTEPRSDLLEELNSFFTSDAVKNLLVEKFEIRRPVTLDAGLQKYLHGYEISPHPDIRRKAATWMLNINPGVTAEQDTYHTHYMKLKEPWRFIGEFWRGNPQFDRDWLPWDWCETHKQQTENNSIVLFSPSNDTLHAVKAKYDHLRTQRTQIYGNLWYDDKDLQKLDYSRFELWRHVPKPNSVGALIWKARVKIGKYRQRDKVRNI